MTLSAEKLLSLMKIDQAVFERPWSEKSWQAHQARTGSFCHLITSQNSLAGFVAGCAGHGEVEIFKVGVLPKYRRAGLARAAIVELFTKCKPCTKIILEYADDNRAAAALYESLGFEKFFTRKSYYNEGQDAHCMQLLNQP